MAGDTPAGRGMLRRMPTYLHQIIAVDRSVEEDAKRVLAEAGRIFTVGGKQDPLTGLLRTYKSNDTEKWPEAPAESRRVQFTTADLLAGVQTALTRLYDIKLTREAGNAAARANVTVDGEDLLEDMPVGFLMALEGQLATLIKDVIDKLPVRDPAEEWHGQETDENLPRGWFATAPRETPTTTRAPQVQILWEPNPEQIAAGYTQPAQVRPYETDVITGKKTLIQYSGQLSRRDVQELRDRASRVLTAVRYAREKANMLEVTDQPAGAKILGYILGDLVPSA